MRLSKHLTLACDAQAAAQGAQTPTSVAGVSCALGPPLRRRGAQCAAAPTMRNLVLLRHALARVPSSAPVVAFAADGPSERGYVLTEDSVVHVVDLSSGKVRLSLGAPNSGSRSSRSCSPSIQAVLFQSLSPRP